MKIVTAPGQRIPEVPKIRVLSLLLNRSGRNDETISKLTTKAIDVIGLIHRVSTRRAVFILMWTSIRVACAVLFLAGNADFVLSTGGNGQDSCLRLLLDVDPGVDDALAITLAATLQNVTIEAITVVAGNAELETAYNNTLRTLNVLNRTDVPVFKGADRSIDGYGSTEKIYFGHDNFGNVSAQYPMSSNPNNGSQTGYAKMIQMAKENPGELTFILVGPLTNMAIALLVEPEFSENIRHVYILGGTLYAKGNVRPSAEFNFFTDPEAALIVLQRTTCPITIIPWEASLQAPVPWDTFYSITNQTGALQKFLRDITNHTVQCCLSGGQSPGGFSLGDFLAVLAAAVPKSVNQTVQNRVEVERCGMQTRGTLVHAWASQTLPHVKRNVTIVESFDVDFVVKYFNATFNRTGV
ncbi:nucleoside hydrolase-like [Dermacentor variabilis]|uniref:nucleoside hydrolase-like n=1 Tax=Dermacentor variabilis TaxID=34621 RepID=UPI003F5BBB79